MDIIIKQVLITYFSLLNSCSSIKRDSIEYIIYRTYAGECMDHCATMYKLENETLLVDTTDSFFDNHRVVNFRGDTLSKEEFEKAVIVKQQIPKLLLRSNSKEFGIPDAYDQGGIYVEIKGNESSIKRFHIDTELSQIPFELRDYAQLIMRVTGFNKL